MSDYKEYLVGAKGEETNPLNVWIGMSPDDVARDFAMERFNRDGGFVHDGMIVIVEDKATKLRHRFMCHIRQTIQVTAEGAAA